MRHAITALSVALMVAVSLPAQGVLSVSASSVAQGASLVVTFTAPEGGATMNDGCIIDLVAKDTPMGPIVYQPTMCSDVILTFGGGQQGSETWSTMDGDGGFHAPGTYWAWTSWTDAAGSSHVAQVSFEVVEAIQLGQETSALLGTRARFRIDAPSLGGHGYVAAASGSQVRGFWMQGMHFALDQDDLFWLSISGGNPLFDGFQGVLTEDGEATGIRMKVPHDPRLSGHSFLIQGLVYDLEGGAIDGASNVLTVWIG